MPTIAQIQTITQNVGREFDECLERCRAQPFPRSERSSKIAGLELRKGQLFKRINEQIAREAAQVRAPLEVIYQRLAAEAGETEEQRNATSDQTRAAQLSTEAAALREKATLVRFDLATAVERKDASDGLVNLEAEMKTLLDQAGELEEEIVSGSNQTLVREASETFDLKTSDFLEAEKHHKRQATGMLAGMVILVGLAFAAVYFLFIKLPSNGLANSGELIPEHVVAFAAGRLAVLGLIGWSLRYLSTLHHAHAWQAVIYRDRTAALGVAELLLRATSSLEEKRRILGELSEVYLKVKTSAFASQKRPRRSTNVDRSGAAARTLATLSMGRSFHG